MVLELSSYEQGFCRGLYPRVYVTSLFSCSLLFLTLDCHKEPFIKQKVKINPADWTCLIISASPKGATSFDQRHHSSCWSPHFPVSLCFLGSASPRLLVSRHMFRGNLGFQTPSQQGVEAVTRNLGRNMRK